MEQRGKGWRFAFALGDWPERPNERRFSHASSFFFHRCCCFVSCSLSAPLQAARTEPHRSMHELGLAGDGGEGIGQAAAGDERERAGVFSSLL